MSWNLSRENLVHQLVALRDGKGTDMAIGVITNWQEDKDIVAVMAPKIDIRQICCLVIGDITIRICDE